MNKINFSNLNKILLFQEALCNEDGIGGYDIIEWVNYCKLWANVKILKNIEKVKDTHLSKMNHYQVTIRYNYNINDKMRIVFQGKILQIKSIILNQDERFLNINALSKE